MGYFVEWLRGASKTFEVITCVALRIGQDKLPENVHLIPLRSRKGLQGKLQVVFRLLRETVRRRNQYDSVFVRGDTVYMVLAGWLWRLLGKRTVLWYTHYKPNWTLRLAAYFSDDVVTAVPESNSLRDALCIGHHIDVGRFQPNPGRVWQDMPRVLIFGRVSPVKRVPWMVETLRTYIEQGQIHLQIRGKASDAATRDALRSCLPESASWQDADLAPSMAGRLYQETDIFINATPGSMDKALLEAAASGCIVLAATRGFLRGLPDDLHWLQFDGAQGLQAALDRVLKLSPAERRLMGLRLRNWVAEHHAMERHVFLLANILSVQAGHMPMRTRVKRALDTWKPQQPVREKNLPVLMFHWFDRKGSAAYDIPRLVETILLLQAHGYHFIGLDDVWEGGTWKLPEAGDRALLLTVDDATEDLLDALPACKALHVPVLVFAPSGVSRLKTSEGVERRVLSKEELRSLPWKIGGHGQSHRSFPAMDDQLLSQELKATHDFVGFFTQAFPAVLAYPRGKHDERVRSFTAAAGFAAAFTVNPGTWTANTDPLRIPRIAVMNWMSAKDVLRAIENRSGHP